MSAPAAVAGDMAAGVLEQARAGDPAAFEQLVRHYDPMLRALAYRLLGDRAQMDDALQEAYVKAFRALPGFRRDAALGTWLYRITYRACLDLMRAEGRRRTTPLPGPDVAADPAGDPGQVAVQRADLARPCTRSPPTSGPPCSWSTPKAWTTPPPPRCWAVAAGTIASRLSRARAALRRALDEGDLR